MKRRLFGFSSKIFYPLPPPPDRQEVSAWLARGVVDDDQSMNVALQHRRPDLFRLVRADWWDAFWIFD